MKLNSYSTEETNSPIHRKCIFNRVPKVQIGRVDLQNTDARKAGSICERRKLHMQLITLRKSTQNRPKS